jgi:TolA-binding protein
MGPARTSTVSRLLIKRKQFSVILLMFLAFPAAAFAAGGKDSNGLTEAVGQAEVAPVSVLQPGSEFKQLVRTISHRIKAEERAAARQRQRQEEERFENLPGGISLETLNAIAACESGGDPTAVSSDGTYRGKYQFDYGTWESVGGSGDPAAAPEAEQDYRAALLYARSGSSPWPVCG